MIMLTNTKYQTTYRKYSVKICKKCNYRLNLKDKIYQILIVGGAISLIIFLLLFFIPVVHRIFLGLFSLCLLLGIFFYLIWELFGPSRSHVSYERATKYNALTYKIF